MAKQHDSGMSTLIMTSPDAYQSGRCAKPRENGSVTSPTQSSALSLSDSFVSESPSMTFGLNEVINGRSNTFDSFRSGSSSLLVTPTNSEIIPLKESPKPRRPMSETRENFLDTAISPEADSCMTSSPASSSNLAVVLTKKGVRHEVIRREATLDNPPGNRHELSYQSPKHSKSFPHLSRITPPTHDTIGRKMSEMTALVHHTDKTLSFNEDIDPLGFHTSDKSKPNRLVKSSSLFKQIGDKLKAPLRYTADMTLNFARRSFDADTDVTTPLTPPSPKRYGSQDRNPSDREDVKRPKSGGKSLLFQKTEIRKLRGNLHFLSQLHERETIRMAGSITGHRKCMKSISVLNSDPSPVNQDNCKETDGVGNDVVGYLIV